MTGADIPQDQWEAFFEEFSLDHAGWIVDLEWPGDEQQTAVGGEYPLETIEADLDSDDTPRLVLFLTGRDPIVVENPEQVSLSEGDGWDDEIVEIETATETLTIHVRFPAAELDFGARDDSTHQSDEEGLPTRNPAAVEDELSIRGSGNF